MAPMMGAMPRPMYAPMPMANFQPMPNPMMQPQIPGFPAPSAFPPGHPDWKVYHTPEGTPYYVNNKTGETVWTLPEPQDDSRRLWKEFKTPEGQTYFFNTVHKYSAWERPADFDKLIGEGDVAAAPAAMPQGSFPSPSAAAQSSQSVPSSPVLSAAAIKAKAKSDEERRAKEQEVERNAPRTGPVRTVEETAGAAAPAKPSEPAFSSEQEAEAAFRQLLTEKGVQTDDKWNQVLPKIVFDSRYKALKTIDDRKRVLVEWQRETEKLNENLRAERMVKAREEFVVMLEEYKEITGGSHFRDVERICGADPRFKALDSEHERQDFVYDFVDKLVKQEREFRRENRQKNLKAFADLLDELTTAGKVAPSTQFRDLVESVKDEPRFTALDQGDRVRVFEDHMVRVLREERERVEKEKEAKRQAERLHRDAFRTLLREKSLAGLITTKSEWQDVAEDLQTDPRCEALCQSAGRGAAEQLLDDFCSDLEEDIRDEKRKFKAIVKDHDITTRSKDSIDDMLEKLQRIPEFSQIDSKYARLLCGEQLEKQKRKRVEKERKKAENKEDFLRILRKKISFDYAPEFSLDYPGQVNVADVWARTKADFALQLSASSAWSRLNEEERLSAFAEHVSKLRAQERERREEASAIAAAAVQAAHSESSKDRKRDKEKRPKSSHKKHSSKHKKRSDKDRDDSDSGSSSDSSSSDSSRSRSRSASRSKGKDKRESKRNRDKDREKESRDKDREKDRGDSKERRSRRKEGERDKEKERGDKDKEKAKRRRTDGDRSD